MQRLNILCQCLLTLNPSVGVKKKKKLHTHAPCKQSVEQRQGGGRMQTESALKYVLSSSTLYCCHCTEDNSSRCQGKEWILLGWLWPSYLSLGYGTDAQAGVTLSPFDSCPGCLLYDCAMPGEGCLCFGLLFGWLGHNDGRLNAALDTVRYLDAEHLMGINLTLELCLLSPHICTVFH